MRILLTTYPLPMAWSQQPLYPLALSHLASVLDDHELVCFDATLEKEPFDALAQLIKQSNPEVIGLTIRNIDRSHSSHNLLSCWPVIAKTVKHLRACSPDGVLVVGGAGYSLFPEEIMKRLPEIDFGVYLEGEKSFPKLLKNLDHPEDVKGIYYRRNGQLVFSGEAELIDFDSLPMPRRDILDNSAYKSLHAIGVQTKRGCLFDCLYCIYPLLTGRKMRLRSPEKVVDEVEILKKKHGINRIYFADNIFNEPLSHAEAICRELVKRKLSVQWAAYFTERQMTADFIKLALESGCVTFSFSPDGSNDANLKMLGKGLKRKRLEAAYDLFKEFPEAKFNCNFLWNYPKTGWKDLRDLISLVFRVKRMKNLKQVGVSNIRILPGARIQKVAIEEGRLDPKDPLLIPKYYDPYPWRLGTLLLNLLGVFARAAMVLRIKEKG